jgi:hypothetical protein
MEYHSPSCTTVYAFPLVGIGTPPAPLPQASERVGESQSRRLEKKLSTLPFSVVILKDAELSRPQSTYTVKKGIRFPSPAGMSLTKLSLAGKNLIIPVQGEFG